jgi:hypothetical protein
MHDGKHKSWKHAIAAFGGSEINGQATSNLTAITWSDGKPESASDSFVKAQLDVTENIRLRISLRK